MPRPIGGEPAKTWMTYIESLEGALAFYAKESHWHTNLGGEIDGEAGNDMGQKAREVLGLPTDYKKLNG